LIKLQDLLAEIEEPLDRLNAAWAQHGIIPKNNRTVTEWYGQLWATEYAVQPYAERTGKYLELTIYKSLYCDFEVLSAGIRKTPASSVRLTNLACVAFCSAVHVAVRFRGSRGSAVEYAFDRNRYPTDEAFSEALQKLTGKTVAAVGCKPGSAPTAENLPTEAASVSNCGEGESGWSKCVGGHSEGLEPVSRASKQPEQCWKLWFGGSKDPVLPRVSGQLPLAWLDFNTA
jgi:hypothetical protein